MSLFRLLTAYRGLSVLACITLLLVLVALLQRAPAWRLDLTQDRLYTLGEGTRQLVENLTRPVTLKLYFSRSLAEDLPHLRDYARRVEDLLHEYRMLNPAKIDIQQVDPQPFSEAEEAATLAGLQGAPLAQGGDTVYLGLIASREGQPDQVVELFSPERERFLEYDISQLIQRLDRNREPVIGVLSSVPLLGEAQTWAVIEQLRQRARVQPLQAPLSGEELAVDVLLLVQPQALGEQRLDEATLYAIDQYVLAGGRALVFVDPLVEASGTDAVANSDDGLQRLLHAWGVEFDPRQVVGDRRWGLRVAASRKASPVPHVGVIGVPRAGLSESAVVTAELDSVNLSSSGYLQLRDDTGIRWQPLITSSDDAMLLPLQRYRQMRDHTRLLNDFSATGERYVMAAWLQGEAGSAFAGPPPGDGQAEYRSRGSINVMLVADVDLLSDRLWVQRSSFFDQPVMMPWAGNGDLVANAVDNLSGSETLIRLRSRGQYSRPFTRVDRLRTEAATVFTQQEQLLLQRLQKLEERIFTLRNQQNGGDATTPINEAQRAEIDAFQTQQRDVRRQLRQVQHELNQSIGALENRLRWLNMTLVPALLLALMALVLFWRRRQSGL